MPVKARDLEQNDLTCGPDPCGGGDYPVEIYETNPVQKTYNGRDYLGVAGIESDYYGSYTNPNYDGGGYLHDFVTAGHFTSLDRPGGGSTWYKNRSIIHQKATVTNHKPNECAIVSQVGGTGEWIGASRDDEPASSDFYGEQMKNAAEAAIGAVSETAGTYIAVAEFIDALANEYGSTPDDEEEWGPKFEYKPSYPHDCTNTLRFAITSRDIGDEVRVTTRQEASIPTVNDPYEVPYADVEWWLTTEDPNINSVLSQQSSITEKNATGMDTREIIDTFPSKRVRHKDLPPYAEVQEMADHGAVYRVFLPFTARTSTSSI